MPRPIPKPPRAEEDLATAGQIRQWARAHGRWPFADGKGARPSQVKPIGPSRLTRTDWS